MNQEVGQLDRQKPSLLDMWAEFTLEWVLPVSLAVIMVGQIFFSAAKHHIGIEHPAWPFWGVLVAGVGLVLSRQLPLLRATRLDIAMLGFASILIVSCIILGVGSLANAMLRITSFVVFPYIAGRLLDGPGIRRFVFALSLLAQVSLPLIGLGLFNMPSDELQADRISTLFVDADVHSVAGVSTIPHASIALGLLLILLAADISFQGRVRGAGRQLMIVLIMGITVWMLMFLASRSLALAAFLVSSALIALGHGSIWRRFALLLILLVAVVASWETASTERRLHFDQIGKAVILEAYPHLTERWHYFGQIGKRLENSVALQKHIIIPPSLARSDCVVYGDSVATRMLMYKSALRLFRDSPIFGAGAGNFGVKADCKFDEEFLSPHNVFLQTLSELGLIGAIVYLPLVYLTISGLVQAIKHGGREYRNTALLLLAIYGLFFLQESISGNYFNGYHFFAITGLISGFLTSQAVDGKTGLDSRVQASR